MKTLNSTNVQELVDDAIWCMWGRPITEVLDIPRPTKLVGGRIDSEYGASDKTLLPSCEDRNSTWKEHRTVACANGANCLGIVQKKGAEEQRVTHYGGKHPRAWDSDTEDDAPPKRRALNGIITTIQSQCVKPFQPFQKTKRSNNWIISSVSSKHMCNDINSFVQLKQKVDECYLTTSASWVQSEGEGLVKILCDVGNKEKWLYLKNVLYIPNLGSNYISVHRLLQSRARVAFSKHQATIVREDGVMFHGQQRGGAYILDSTFRLSTSKLNSS